MASATNHDVQHPISDINHFSGFGQHNSESNPGQTYRLRLIHHTQKISRALRIVLYWLRYGRKTHPQPNHVYIFQPLPSFHTLTHTIKHTKHLQTHIPTPHLGRSQPHTHTHTLTPRLTKLSHIN